MRCQCGEDGVYHVHDIGLAQVEDALLQRLVHCGDETLHGGTRGREERGDLLRGELESHVPELSDDPRRGAVPFREEGEQLSAAVGQSQGVDEQVQESSQLVLLLLRLSEESSAREAPTQSPRSWADSTTRRAKSRFNRHSCSDAAPSMTPFRGDEEIRVERVEKTATEAARSVYKR